MTVIVTCTPVRHVTGDMSEKMLVMEGMKVFVHKTSISHIKQSYNRLIREDGDHTGACWNCNPDKRVIVSNLDCSINAELRIFWNPQSECGVWPDLRFCEPQDWTKEGFHLPLVQLNNTACNRYSWLTPLDSVDSGDVGPLHSGAPNESNRVTSVVFFSQSTLPAAHPSTSVHLNSGRYESQRRNLSPRTSAIGLRILTIWKDVYWITCGVNRRVGRSFS